MTDPLISKNNDTQRVKSKEKNSYNKWESDVGGLDNLSSDGRLLMFLLADNGKYLSALRPTRTQKIKISKRTLAQRCLEYFKEQGVNYRTCEQIRSRMKKWMNDYSRAYILFKKTATGPNARKVDPKEFEASLRKICTYFYELKAYTGDIGVIRILGGLDTDGDKENVTTTSPIDEVEINKTDDSSSDSKSTEDEIEDVPPLKKRRGNSRAKVLKPAMQKILSKSDDKNNKLEKMWENYKYQQLKGEMKLRQLTEVRLTLEVLLNSGVDSSSTIIKDLVKKFIELVDDPPTPGSRPESSNTPH